MTGAEFIYLMIGSVAGTICGFLLGYNHKLTDAELRAAKHNFDRRWNDEHSIDFPENSKIKSPDDWPRGGI